ncbi:hypothetical protein [Bradyrhizobium erythrophlei]|uniref:Uncharacterized protein n=1 Tax=Bradyrhizobium erythrophlei TaxID=1437360 RepID=A0A1H4NP55_9BRAD|nr:hypothetical protein [Bradyrhizobium erythrophlei]SEB97017.1 hypothetical protein SAMN05444164_0688 [Bradyrhizobium erythrophlei]
MSKPNEPAQAALDSANLSRIRNAQAEAAAQNEVNNTAKNKLRGTYAQTQAQGLHNEAAKLALDLVEGGDEAIDEFCEKVRKAGVYVGYLGKVLSPRQFELFGMAGVGPTPEDERAKLEGRAAGFRLDSEPGSKETDNPYEIGSLKGQAWLSAFRDARSERDHVLSMPAPATEGEKGGASDAEEGKA